MDSRESGRAEHCVRVNYCDTDQGGVAHHSSYIRWFEAARVEFLRARGVEYRQLELDEHRALPVVDLRVRYHRPARFDELLEVQTWVGRVSRASVRFDYAISHAGTLLTEAQVLLACVELPAMRVCSLPASVRKACGDPSVR